MLLQEAPGRRKKEIAPLGLVVEAGVICRFSLRNNAAKRLYLTHNVPSSLAARVLFHDSQRRRTHLEIAMVEQGHSANLTTMTDWHEVD